jgi:hypothetical protein
MNRADARKLEELRTDCGCRVGGRALCLALVLYASWAWLEPGSRTARSRLLVGAAVVLAAAVAGKILGILWARYRYRRLARRLSLVR